MKKLLALSLIAVTMIATSTAHASSLRLPHRPWAQMTRTQKVHWLRRQIRHDRSIIRFYKHHRELQSAELAHAAKWARGSLKIAMHNLRRLTYHAAYSGFPPHHALWMCIHGREGAWNDPNSGHNGHYGGLQMTSPWGKGVYYVYRANYLTQQQQEWKAELGYRASGFSYTWLIGQWNHPECMYLR